MELTKASGYNVVNPNYIDVEDKLLNLENFPARSEINSPGMDDDYCGAMQLNYISGNIGSRSSRSSSIPKEEHSEWWYNLNQSTPQKQEHKKMMQHYQEVYEAYLDYSSSSSSSSFTEYDYGNYASLSMDLRIASGILRSSRQFWRRTYHHIHGKARSVFQRKTNSPARAEWTSNGNCIWISDAGRQVILKDVHLLRLTDVEIMILQQQAIEEINLLDIGINPMAYSEIKHPSKNKTRITNLFRKGGRGSVFGRSLEYIVAKEQKKKRGTCLMRRSISSNVGSPINAITEIPSTAEPIEWIPLQVPKLVRNCIEHLERYGLKSVGIFRVSTSQKRTAELKKEFDRSDCKSIDPDTNPHMVATLLKKFLRDLPEPLLCEHLYKDFVRSQAMCNRHQQMEVFSHLVRVLPTAHRDTLYVLLRFLAKVASCSNDVIGPDGTIHVIGNKMDSTNLATVFAPNILRPSLTNDSYNKYDELDKMLDVIDVVRLMIDHYERLFCVPAELMQDIYVEMSDKFPKQLNYLCEHRYICDRAFSKTITTRNPTIRSPTPCIPRLVENIFIDDPYQIGPSGSRQYREIAEPMFEIDQSVHRQEDQQGQQYDPMFKIDQSVHRQEDQQVQQEQQYDPIFKIDQSVHPQEDQQGQQYDPIFKIDQSVHTQQEQQYDPMFKIDQSVHPQEDQQVQQEQQYDPMFKIDQSVHPQQDQQYEWYQESDTTTSDSENESETEISTSSSDLGHVILHSRTGGLDKVLKVIPKIIITDVDTGKSSQYPMYERQDLVLSEFGCENHKD